MAPVRQMTLPVQVCSARQWLTARLHRDARATRLRRAPHANGARWTAGLRESRLQPGGRRWLSVRLRRPLRSRPCRWRPRTAGGGRLGSSPAAVGGSVSSSATPASRPSVAPGTAPQRGVSAPARRPSAGSVRLRRRYASRPSVAPSDGWRGVSAPASAAVGGSRHVFG